METGSGSPAAAAGGCGTGNKGTCCGKIIKGAILGGLILFAWFAASWHALPWHAHSILGFQDEKAVAEVLAKNAPDSGVYVLPFTDMGKLVQKTDKPFAFVSVFAPGVDIKATMASMMLGAFVMSVLMGAILSCLLSKKAEGVCPMAYSLKVGLLVGVAAFGPNYIFYHFPLNWTLGGIADEVIGFGIAGAIVGRGIFKMKLGCCRKSCGANSCGAGACGTDARDKK